MSVFILPAENCVGFILPAENLCQGFILPAENLCQGFILPAENLCQGFILLAENFSQGLFYLQKIWSKPPLTVVYVRSSNASISINGILLFKHFRSELGYPERRHNHWAKQRCAGT